MDGLAQARAGSAIITTMSARLAGFLTGFTGQYFPRASALIPLANAAYERGDYTTAEQAMPIYLRDKVV